MQLNNFEKQAKEKLSNREINPSENSWDRLNAMLSVAQKPKKNKGFFWLQIAASFVLFASIGYYFYNQNTIAEPVNEVPIVVEENSEFRIQNSENKEENNETIKEGLVEHNLFSKDNQKTSINKQKIAAASKTRNPQSKISNQQSIINNEGVSIINSSSQNQNTINSTINNQQSIIKNRYISAQELLAQVENSEIVSQPTFIKSRTKVKVDANDLLSSAENELNQTFRENVLQKINKNFNNIKTVLANRNYQE